MNLKDVDFAPPPPPKSTCSNGFGHFGRFSGLCTLIDKYILHTNQYYDNIFSINSIFKLKSENYRRKSAFTLAEVLITLGIIGIVAAMTLPSLIGAWKDKQFKTAYKKAYSDFSNAFQEAIVDEKFTRTGDYDNNATTEEMNILKEKFKVIIECPRNTDITLCWKKGDTVCGGSCWGEEVEGGIDLENGQPRNRNSDCFIDASGRSWCTYVDSQNIFVVDTNGFSSPNRFGKDRWIFKFADKDGKRALHYSNYYKVAPLSNTDIIKQSAWCKWPPCYYQSWLLN